MSQHAQANNAGDGDGAAEEGAEGGAFVFEVAAEGDDDDGGEGEDGEDNAGGGGTEGTEESFSFSCGADSADCSESGPYHCAT